MFRLLDWTSHFRFCRLVVYNEAILYNYYLPMIISRLDLNKIILTSQSCSLVKVVFPDDP